MARRRSFALILVMVMVLVAVPIAYTFLAGQSTTTSIARNMENHTKAKGVAESGLRLALAHMRANEDWRTDLTNGTWVADQAIFDGTFTIIAEDGVDSDRDGVVDGDGDLSDDSDDLLTLTVTGKVGGASHTVHAVVTPVPGTPTKVLFIVADSGNLNDAEVARKALLESWGFEVQTLSDNESSAAYDAASADNSVAYVSVEVVESQVGTKLSAAAIGVVVEEAGLCDELGISSSGSNYTGTAVDIVDNTHYICSPFDVGELEILADSDDLNVVGSSLATGAVVAAQRPSSSTGALVAIDAGETLSGGGMADGRRVMLPWGGNGFDFANLNDNGKTILKRALQWAAQTPTSPDPVLHYDFDSQSGTTIVDREGSVNLTMLPGNGAIDWVTDAQVGTGVYFNQNAQSGTAVAMTANVNVADELKSALQASGALTAQVFLKAEGFDGSYGRALSYSRDTGSTTRNFTIAADDDGATTADFIARVKNAASESEYKLDSVIEMDEFQVLAFTVDHSSTTNNIKLYLNGQLVKTSSSSGNFSAWTSEMFLLGNERTLNRPFRGYMYDVKVWDSALSAAQLAANAAAMLPAESEEPQLIALYEFNEVLPPDPVLLAHWKLDEITGGGGETTTAVDDAAGNDGTYTGGAVGNEVGFGDGGTAVRFDGSNDYVLVPHSAAYLLDRGAVSFWFNSNSMSGHHALFSKDSSNYDTGGHLHIYAYGSQIRVRLQSTSADYVLNSPSGVSSNQWHHVVLNFGVGGMQLYLDDSLVDSDAYTGGLGVSSGGTGNHEPLVIGAGTWGSGDLTHTPLSYYFAGLIDDVRIYDYPLTAGQVSDLHGAGEVGPGASVGNLVEDTCGFGGALDLTIDDTDNIAWIEGGGLEFTATATAKSTGAATKLYNALTDTDEMTLEVKFTPTNLVQGGPARIVSYSSDGNNRNFTFCQLQQKYDQRLRTTSTSANGTPDILSGNVLSSTTVHHVIVTFGEGVVKMYREGSLEVTQDRSGTFNWDNSYPLVLGNEATSDRPLAGHTLSRGDL